MDANELKRLYEQQFEEDLEPPIREDVDRRTTLGMLRNPVNVNTRSGEREHGFRRT